MVVFGSCRPSSENNVRLRIDMNDTDIQARFVFCVLHDNPVVIQELCSSFSEYEYDDEYSGQGYDQRMIRAFEVSENTVRPTLTEKDIQSIACHRNVAYVLSPRLNDASTLDEAARALRFVERCFDSGARAVKCESSGLTHGKGFWKKVTSKIDDGALYWAWVRRPLDDNGVIYSCGMHLLGYPDIEICGETVINALELIDGFAMYLIIDQPGERLRTGQTFSLSSGKPSFRVTESDCNRYEDDDFLYNPHGYWRLEKI